MYVLVGCTKFIFYTLVNCFQIKIVYLTFSFFAMSTKETPFASPFIDY